MNRLARVVRGAPRNIGAEVPVFRDGGWVRDSRAAVGDVYVATEVDFLRWPSKLEEVDPKELPPLPGKGGAENGGPEEAAGRAGATATIEADDPGSADSAAGVVDVELYRIGESEVFELPSGNQVVGVQAAIDALELELSDLDAEG